MRNSIFDWVRNLQHLIIKNIKNSNTITLTITQVDEIKENDTDVIEMTTNEFEHLPKTAEMLERLMVGWKINVYPRSENKCIIKAEKRQRFY